MCENKVTDYIFMHSSIKKLTRVVVIVDHTRFMSSSGSTTAEVGVSTGACQ